MKIMPEAGSLSVRHKAGAGDRYAALMAAIVRRLPFGLDRVVAPNLLGFALINLCTFTLDLALLTALHGGLRWPVPVSITLSYLTRWDAADEAREPPWPTISGISRWLGSVELSCAVTPCRPPG